MTRIDTLIVGQGLAGTSLAWHLRARGQAFLIIDDPRPDSASRVAAGLVTPVTGQALRARPGFLPDLAECRALYTLAEHATAGAFWRERAALRLLDSATAHDRAIAAMERSPELLAKGTGVPAGFRPVDAVATMPPAARLDVPAYLKASADLFSSEGTLAAGRVGARHIRIGDDGIVIESLGLIAANLVWCGGVEDLENAWLPDNALSPARGEMIRVALPGVTTKHVIHRGGRWLRPLPDGTYQFGATYDHTSPVAETTPEARERLMGELTTWLVEPPALLEQVAGVRPVARDRTPFIHTHPVHRRVHAVNGLGSHGVLVAPRLASELAKRLCD